MFLSAERKKFVNYAFYIQRKYPSKSNKDIKTISEDGKLREYVDCRPIHKE